MVTSKTASPKVLIIDGTADRREKLKSILRFNSFEVEHATNGMSAVGLFESGNYYDVVLISFELEFMGGLETFKLLQCLNLSPPAPICFIYGNVGRDEIKESLDLGVLAVISDINDYAQVIKLMNKHLLRRGQQQQQSQ